MSGKNLEKVKASMFVRIFGNEISYRRFTERDLRRAPQDLMKMLTKGMMQSFSHNQEIINTGLTVPTLAGT